MFTKMQKFYILTFAIALALAFADANVFAETEKQEQTAAATPATTVTPAILEVTRTVGARTKEGRALEQSVEVKTTQREQQQQQIMSVATAAATPQTLAATTTATPVIATTATATVTTATTVTLASSNAPATLTTTNDADERVLSTTATQTLGAAATATIEQAKLQESVQEQHQQQLKQQQSHEQAKKVGEPTAGKKQILAFNENNAREEPTTVTTILAMPTKMNAAVVENVAIAATPATSTTTTPATGGGAATKITEMPTVNFESKSRADALPSRESAMSSDAAAVHASKDNGNEAKTQIIKNAKKLRTKRLNEWADSKDERAELGGEKSETVTEVTNSGHEANKAATEQTQDDCGDESEEDEISQSQLEEQPKSVRVVKKQPQSEQRKKWPKRTATTAGQITGRDNTESLFSKHSVTEVTNVNSQTKEAAMALATSERSKQQARDDMNAEEKLKNGLYRIKLAELVTDEYNGSSSGEEAQLNGQQKVEVETKATTMAAAATRRSAVVDKQLSAEEEQVEEGGNKELPATYDTLQQEQPKQAQEQSVKQQRQASSAKPQQQQQQTKLADDKDEVERRQQELRQQQQQQAIQLRREQQANKSIENLQVQQHNEQTASELLEYKGQNKNKNNVDTVNNKQQQLHTSDHAPDYTTPASTVVATPPALNIVDLYPMKMEDFNPIIRDSNAKLLKERTIYKPTDSTEDVRIEPTDELTQVGHSPGLGVSANVQRHQQNILPNEVDAADNIIQRYDNINNLAARQNVNRRPITQSTAGKSVDAASAMVVATPTSQEAAVPRHDEISDFTGKVLAEQDGVITEIEQKFRLNEFAASATATASTTTTTSTGASDVAISHATPPHDRTHMPTHGKSSYSVNHKIQAPKSAKNKYASGNSNDGKKSSNAQRLPQPQQHDFIERRVKKSFDFPMHRAAASASDALAMPHVDFANTKFNTGSGATQTLSDSALSGTENGGGGGGAGAMRAALGTHPEFSTTKFYNSKELYNEMMQHNRKRLKAKVKMEQVAAAAAAATSTSRGATTTATQGGGAETAAGRFALRQSANLEVSKYVPVTDASKPIMGEVHMKSQREVNIGSLSALAMRAEKNDAMAVAPSREPQSEVNAKSLARQAVHKEEKEESVEIDLQLQDEGTTSHHPPPNVVDKPTKKYQKELQRAKLLLKSILLPTSANAKNKHAGRASKSNPTAATTATTTTMPSNHKQNGSQSNLHAPPTVSGASVEKLSAIAARKVDLTGTDKTFDTLSLRRKSSIVAVIPTPTPTDPSAAVGNIDSNNDDGVGMTEVQVRASETRKLNDFDGAAILHVKRAKQAPTTTASATPTTTTHTSSNKSAMTVDPSSNFATQLTLHDDQQLSTTTPPLIYPYPQLRRQQATSFGQPHDTTATTSSSSFTTTTSTMFHAARVTATTTTNLWKSPSKPIVRPRILSPLQEKINSLECELQSLPSDSHLWRGNETHELLLPITTSENCPYGGTDCSPLLVSWEGEAEIQSGDILIVEINDTLLSLNEHNNTHTSLAHNTQVYQVTRSGHEHCDVTEGILLDITPLFVDGRKLVTLYDKDLTEGVNLLIVVSELWGSQCVRLKVTAKTDNCGESAECSGKGVCYSNAVMEEYECQCCSGFAGPHCEEIDACTPSPCTNNGICVDLSQGHEGNSYQCLCPYGYTGKNCQYESDPCNSAECKNGGSCVGNSTHFRCDCTPGYTGPLCQHSLNECESSPCVHGICVDQEDGFRCFCQPGFAGELCNFEYNECESNPCQNDGECIDHIGNFECRCTKGYTGARCQIKVDFCANNPCPDGHRCIDHGNDFSCECPGGHNGLDCNQMPRKQCNENLCKHGGTCWTSGASFYCACRPGYTGNMCEDEFVVETVVSSSEFMVDDTSARNFNDKTFGSSVVLKSPIELHNAYFGAGVLAAAIFIVAVVVAICHCKVNQTYRKFSTRSSTFFPILGFGRRNKSQNKLNKHWLSGKGLGGGGGGGGGTAGGSLRSSGSTTSLTRGHLPSAHNGGGNGAGHQSHQRQQQLQQQQQLGGQMHERPFQRHLAMNLENDMYYTVDFSENSQHSPLIQ